ncbi:unnamed protein product [Lactuca saligna]|uniref:Transmembrane protein n=1 Tax=Lactuca saligna TaxID=75948 RepID=A0AA35ZLW5_LACSI|nr:unnamed protein product [Lactuca saligna]
MSTGYNGWGKSKKHRKDVKDMEGKNGNKSAENVHYTHSASSVNEKLQIRLRKCSFFEWKDEEHANGYYKNLLYSLKQKLDAKDEMSKMNKLRRRIAEVEFLLSQEQYKVAKSEKEVHDARKAIGRYRMIVSLLFACLALCVLKLGGSM